MNNGSLKNQAPTLSQPPSSSSSDSEDFQLISVNNVDVSGTDDKESATQSNDDVNGSDDQQLEDENLLLTKAQYEKLKDWILSAIEFEQRNGTSFCDTIRSNPRFSDPCMAEKMLNYCQVDAFQSNLSSSTSFPNDYFDESGNND